MKDIKNVNVIDCLTGDTFRMEIDGVQISLRTQDVRTMMKICNKYGGAFSTSHEDLKKINRGIAEFLGPQIQGRLAQS